MIDLYQTIRAVFHQRFGANLRVLCAHQSGLTYVVSCPELDTMAALAQSLPGCYGARHTGAGSRGCTLSLVARQTTKAFVRDLASGYT